MSGLGLVIFIVGWIWTIRAGVGVGLLCALLNFFFPPLSQFIFCFYERALRVPTVVMCLGMLLMAIASTPGARKADTVTAQHTSPAAGAVARAPYQA